MEKIQVGEANRSIYQSLVRAAQQTENSMGNTLYKLSKITRQREQIDVELKSWWDRVADELGLDKTKDFYVDSDGTISMVERPEVTDKQDASEEKEDVVDMSGGNVSDLK